MALTFTGTQRITRAAFTFPSPLYSVCFWCKNPTTTGDPYTFFSVNEIGNYFTGTTSWRIDLSWTANCGVWGCDPGVTLTGWHHYAITHDATINTTLPKMYVDGVSKTVTNIVAAAATFAGSSQNFVVGNDDDGSPPLGGSLEWLSVHNVILTSAEIGQAYLRGFTPRGLQLGYGMGGLSEIFDLSGNVRNGTLTGTPAVVVGAPDVIPLWFSSLAGGEYADGASVVVPPPVVPAGMFDPQLRPEAWL